MVTKEELISERQMMPFSNRHICDAALSPNLVHRKKIKDVRLSVDVLYFQHDTETVDEKMGRKRVHKKQIIRKICSCCSCSGSLIFTMAAKC